MSDSYDSSKPMLARGAEAVFSRSSGSELFDFDPADDMEPVLSPAAQPGSILKEIRSHIGEGRHRAAQHLAKAAAARFPKHSAVQRIDRALNRPAVTTHPASGRDTTAEFAWLKNPPEANRGKWVAIVDDGVIAASEDPGELLASVRSMDLPKSPLVVRVD